MLITRRKHNQEIAHLQDQITALRSEQSSNPRSVGGMVERQERALTGLSVSAGMISDDYDAECQGTTWFSTVDKMRNNARVKAIISLVTLPVQGVDWTFEPRGKSQASVEAAELLTANFMEECDTNWDDVIRLAVLGRFYGVRLLQPWWKVDGDQVSVDFFRDLAPSTYYRWQFEEGRCTGVHQQGTDTDSVYREVDLQMEDLLRFTWQEEKGNPEGIGDCRPMRPDWKRLEFLNSVMMVAVERAGVGDWMATIPDSRWSNDDFKNEMKAMLAALRSKSTGAALVPEGVILQVMAAIDQQGLQGLQNLAEMFKRDMAIAGLANILNVGMTDVGTQALANVLLDMFLLALRQTNKWLWQNFNGQIVKRWCGYNYPGLPEKEYPNLHASDPGLLLDKAGFAGIISNLVGPGKTIPDEDGAVDGWVRGYLGLPEKTEVRSSAIDRTSPGSAINRTTTNRAINRPTTNIVTLSARRPKRDWQALQARRDAQASEFSSAMLSFLGDVRDQALSDVSEVSDPSEVRKLTLSGRDEYEGLIRDYYGEIYQSAGEAIRDEKGLKGSWKPSREMDAWMDALAASVAEQHYATMLTGLRMDVLKNLQANVAPAILLENATTTLTRSATENMRDMVRNGQQIVDVINAGLSRSAPSDPSEAT